MVQFLRASFPTPTIGTQWTCEIQIQILYLGQGTHAIQSIGGITGTSIQQQQADRRG